jgi:hypothetical protein
MEAHMKNSKRFLVTAGVAAILTLSSLGAVLAQNEPKQSINPGQNPSTGQINSGSAPQASQSSEAGNIPATEEARAALMQPISRQPSAGDSTPGTTGSADRQSQAQNSGAANEPPPSGPIGSFGQTIPAKFSKRNDVLDRLPIMAWPLRLTDEQRKQIYDAVMAEKSSPVAGADALKPASELSPNQALNEMRPLPESVRGIADVSRLYYIKAKDKVLLIEPNVRTVVDQITAS